jgi:hypothetical protein
MTLRRLHASIDWRLHGVFGDVPRQRQALGDKCRPPALQTSIEPSPPRIARSAIPRGRPSRRRSEASDVAYWHNSEVARLMCGVR